MHDDPIIHPDQANKITNIMRQIEGGPQLDDRAENKPVNNHIFEEEDEPLQQNEIFIPTENQDAYI